MTLDLLTGVEFQPPEWHAPWSVSQRVPETGECRVQGERGWITLPSYLDLERHALWIVHGGLTRMRAPFTEWLEEQRSSKGTLRLEGKDDDAMRSLLWTVHFREAGDLDSYGFSTGNLSPQHALAWVIAVAWEHHLEIVANSGGTA